jgi:hypothetical protein
MPNKYNRIRQRTNCIQCEFYCITRAERKSKYSASYPVCTLGGHTKELYGAATRPCKYFILHSFSIGDRVRVRPNHNFLPTVWEELIADGAELIGTVISVTPSLEYYLTIGVEFSSLPPAGHDCKMTSTTCSPNHGWYFEPWSLEKVEEPANG